MIETDLPVLAALAEVQPPAVDSAGARFLRLAWRSGPDGVPQDDAEVWAAWVDLGLWQQPPVDGPVDLTRTPAPTWPRSPHGWVPRALRSRTSPRGRA